MSETRIKIQSIVENQLPDFVAEDNPLFAEFLKQYYISQEYPSGASDLIQNIDKNIKLDEIYSSISTCLLSESVSFSDTTINVSTLYDRDGKILTGTEGFPDRYGIIKIDDEIITYTSKTAGSFVGCVRGFSGVTSYSKPNNPEELVFSTSNVDEHILQEYVVGAYRVPTGPIVYNLSGLFFGEFLKKLKRQFIPGFSDRTLESDLNENLFIKQSKDFYSSKGTDKSFKILFGALYGDWVDVIKPREYLFRPSDAGWRRTKDLVVEKIEGNPLELLNNTLYQNAYNDYDITEAYAAITDVEQVSIGGTTYYKLSFDADYNKDLILDGTVYGNFSVHPKTLVISPVSSGATVLDVDSTVGFAHSGELFLTYDHGGTGIASYTSKSVTQFFGIASTAITSGIGTAAPIRLNVEAYGYSGINTDNPISVRVGSVLKETVIPEKTYLFSNDDAARIKTLGISSSTIRRNNWIDNVANSYKIDTFTLQNESNYTYEFVTYDKHNFRIGDTAQVTREDTVLVSGTGETVRFNDCEVVDIQSAYRVSVRGQGEMSSDYNWSIQRYLRKVDSSVYPYLNQNNANIQNTYTDYSDEVLVASPSLPYYNDQSINPYDRKVTLSGSYSGTELDILANDPNAPDDHGFYTGDRVYYKPFVVSYEDTDTDGFVSISTATSKFPELNEGLYFVRRVNSSKINLAKSPSNIQNGIYISVSGIVTSNTLQDYDFYKKEIKPQNILRHIKEPINRSGNYEIEPGDKIGVFVNGVELLDQKSSETVFYGRIKNIDVGAPGQGYDIINPPSLDITDAVGSGATGICAVKGSLDRIEILDPGFDYLDKPYITITGGNGNGASAEVNIKSIEHLVSFDASPASDDVDIEVISGYPASSGIGSTNIIGFSTYHKFRDYEKVVYKTDKQNNLVGLTTDSFYHVSVVNSTKIKLHNTESDAVSGINTIPIENYGVGIQYFKAAVKKEVISVINVTNSGEGYQNKKRTTTTSGISTSRNTINIDFHGYETGETLTYATTGTAVEGLNTSNQYLVKKLNDYSFKLSHVGLGTTSKTQYLDTDQYIDLRSIGSGVHSFNYPTISVTVTGNIGVSTLANQDFSAQVQPIFRGEIDSVHLTDNGSQYGSDHIINYDRQPLFEFRSGKNAETIVIVNNGSIQEVLVTRGGSGYNSPPNITIEGTGKYATLVPVIQDGEIKEIRVVNGGRGYDDTTTLTIEAAGKDGRLRANLEKWTVNLFQKYVNTLTPDDGVIETSLSDDGGLEYCHLYAPRKLRETVFVKSQGGTIVYGATDSPKLVEGEIQYGVSDLRTSSNEEQTSLYHSPILGWAYDGNPIYGPYGYTTPEGGTVRAMVSGYEAISNTTRPPEANFPQGFFNEDFKYKGTGDLDEHNGRFAITPEYPNGVYAYHTTINNGETETDGAFKGYFRPTFPYVIGTSFYSQPNAFNFSKYSNTNDYELNNSKWFRNTLGYRFKSSNSSYPFVFDPDNVKNQIVNIDYASDGGVQSVGVVTGGFKYNVNDRVLFDNALTGGTNAAAKVKNLYSPGITSVSVATTSFSGVEFETLEGVGNIIGFTTAPHGLKNLETLNVSGLSSYFANLEGSYTLGIRTDDFRTTLGVGTTGTTGLTTFFYTAGFLNFPYIRENDVLNVGIGTTAEKVKVLNVEPANERIRVVREYDGTVGVAFSAATLLVENPRKFKFNTGFRTDFSYTVNREIYFNPNESVGVGTSAIAGIGSTITFSMPGLGATQVFVPHQAIYLPNHGLKTGEKVRYSNHGGTGIGCWHAITGITSGTQFALPEAQDLYVAKISNDFVGISTIKVGLGTTGTFVGVGSTTTQGLPFFRNFGIGDYHSFTTKRTTISGEIDQNVVTVSVADTHGLSLNDIVQFTALPKDTETITVKYDNDNRRVVFNSSTWAAGKVSTSEDTITISDHGLSTGDKVIYTASTASGGLVDEEMYYVLYYTKDKIRLCKTRYDLNLTIPKYVDITTATAGTISLINPQLNVYKNKIVQFDLSDSSLSSIVGLTSYSAFALNFYKDPEFQYEFESTETSVNFEVVRTGEAGITNTANVKIFLNDYVPTNFYYKLDVINEDNIADIKKEIVIDKDVFNHNQITLVDSKYSGPHTIVGLGTTTFNFTLSSYPEASSYNSSTANLYYTTKALSAYGPIAEVEVYNAGTKYEFTPGITTVSSKHGKNAILEVGSHSIGKVEKTTIENIGFDYPSDFTLKPSLNLPEILTIEPLTSFASIGISSGGRNYLTDPELVVLDGYTNKLVDDVHLIYQVGATSVKIFQNTYGMNNVLPTIIPIHNSNGVGINSITYSTSSPGIVTAGINTGFSDIFPVAVGDKVLIENISVGVASTGKGYNSDAYNYALFPVTAIDPNLGGLKGSITWDMSSVLDTNEYPGFYDSSVNYGRIIPQKDFPIFDIKLKTNDYFIGETVTSPTATGVVESWNNKVKVVKVISGQDFTANDTLSGETSRTKGIIKNKVDFDSYVELGPYSQVNKGWTYDTGILNNNVQRLPNNEYYQYFSYALKSRIPYETWNDPVSVLNHTSGFMKFSDLVVETQPDEFTGIFANNSITDVTVDIEGEGHLACVYTFDLASEKTVLIGSKLVSNEIIFENRVLTDYFESKGNRVLIIDDFSGEFNHNPRPNAWSVVDDYKLGSSRAKKFFTYVRDTRYTQERQVMVVTLVHDGSNAVINQYGRIETHPDLGSFDWKIKGNEGQLLFYPVKSKYNNYDVTNISWDLASNSAGIGSIALGSVAHVNSHHKSMASGTSSATTIVGIASTYRSSKVMVEIGADDESFYEFDELNIIHDGSTVDLVEYGQLTDNNQLNPSSSYAGLGTYYAYLDGSRIKIDFTPDSAIGVAHSVNSTSVSIASSTSLATGVGTATELTTGLIDSWYTSIAASGTPGITTIAEYHNDSHAAYYIVQVEDTTNKRYEMAEVLVADDDTTPVITEWGHIQSGTSGLGTIGVSTTSSARTALTFIPNHNIKVQVRVFQNVLSLVKDDVDTTTIDLDNASINSSYGTYRGTHSDIKREFGLLHGQRPIFQRFVDGSDTDIVSVSSDTITIPDHFFVTGEKLRYSWAGIGSTQAIGIAQTTVSGLTTTRLPQTVYAVKVNESTLRFASSAENALVNPPTYFDITSVGIGTSHSFTSYNQNAKAIVAIDNVIQSPVVAGVITTTLAKDVALLDTKFTFSGITSFFSGNLVQINDEIIKINSVGFGSTNVILVERPWMGTGLAAHSAGDLVTIVEGNYNIRENQIHFVTAPYGKDPISTTTGAPDDRDWTGITTHSTFQGRTFMRSGKKGTVAETYNNNMIFDDISNDFTGIAKTFTLKSDKSNALGFSTSNGVILINGIFQGPEGVQSRVEDYDMKESAGISSIFFTGTASSVTYDPNNANVPVGGIIVSVGSTEGFGFQPLVAAGGTPVVSSAGTIQSIGIGTSGSGYRLNIQPTVNVAIQTSSLYAANYTAIGTAQIVNGGITGIAITNPHVFYAPVDVSNVGYSSLSGLSTVTTHQAHGLQVGEEVKLSGIAFTCDYTAPIGIYTADYTSSTGVMTVTTSSAHGFNAYGKSSVVIFTGLGMTCAIDSGVSTHYYPRGHDPAYNNAVSVASTSTTQITVNVGVAGPGDQYAHTFKRASASAIRSGGDYLHQFVSGVTSCVVSGGNYLHTFDSVGVTSITVTGIGSITPTAATYNPLTGDMVLTVGSGHTYTTSNTVGFGTSSIVFTCALDDDSTTHSYPRATDPVVGVNTAITATTDETITVNVGASRSVFFDVYDAQYTGSTGIMTLNIGSHGLTTGTSIRLMNNGLSFRCALDDYRTIHTYPRSTDTYYDTAISIAATAANTISLNVGISSLKYDDVSAATYDASTGDLVLTVGAGHSISEGTSIGIATESLTFTCARDAHATEHSYPRKGDPTYAGVPIDSVGTTTTFTVNVGTSTVPTFYQGGGKVQAAIIAPRAISGIGTTLGNADTQDPAYPGTPIVSVINNKTFTVNTGVSTRTHFYARGGKIEKNLKVKFDDPLSYSNIPLIYSSESTQGIGTYATIDIVVGQGSSVIDFEIKQTGYGFGQGEILTVHHGGSAGIPTDPSLPYKEFQITIDETFNDAFAGWTLGDLQVLDDWDDLCDGANKTFPIKYDGEYLTIRAAKGSNIDVKATLLIFVNDVLQKPGEAYDFSGGSQVKFSEALKSGDSTKVLFYKGTGEIDVLFKDTLETVKVGDELTLYNEPRAPFDQGYGLHQDVRVVTGINTTDSVETNPYAGPGITTDDTLLRPIKWCKQTKDKIIDGIRIGKDRTLYEPHILPTAYLLQNVGVGSTQAWVSNAKPFFDPINENNTDTKTYTVEIISQDSKVSASATANVSTAGTITSLSITDGGYGYTSAPTVTIASPVGLGTTPGDCQAYATATISSGVVNAITIGSTPGSGYTSTNPPVVLIGDPTPVRGKATSVTYTGDYGIISGIKSTSVGVATTGIVFDFFIPPDSEQRDSDIVGVTTVSGITTGSYFTISNSTVGNGVTSLDAGSGTVGIGTTFLDNVYQVAAVSIGVTAAESKTGAGLTAVAHVTVSVANLEGLTGLGYSSYYGNFSWGRVAFGLRSNPNAYNAYTNDGVTGISTGGIVRRLYPLKWKNYS